MDYTKAFTYPQQDADWLKKFLIAGALNLVPVVGWLLVVGYMLEVTRRVVEHNSQLLPEWRDWGNLFKKGLYVAVIGLVYALPIIVLALCSAIPNVAYAFMLRNGNDAAAGLAPVRAIASSCFGCLTLVYAIFLGMTLPAALGKVAATDQLGSAFRFGEVIALVRAKPAVYLIIMLLSAVAASLLSSVGSIVCLVGAAWGSAYAGLIGAYLDGEAYLTASA